LSVEVNAAFLIADIAYLIRPDSVGLSCASAASSVLGRLRLLRGSSVLGAPCERIGSRELRTAVGLGSLPDSERFTTLGRVMSYPVLTRRHRWKVVMAQLIQVLGSLLILTGFASAQWGFLLLEGVWAIVSGISLIGVLRQRAAKQEN
jgi:hypothetical protein